MVKEILLVGMGSAFGSITRVFLGNIINNKKFPMGTFVLNITGAFFLGILTSMEVNKYVYIFLGDGYLAAYTTFSTFMYEGFTLSKNKKIDSVIYILISVILGIVAFGFGYLIFKIKI